MVTTHRTVKVRIRPVIHGVFGAVIGSLAVLFLVHSGAAAAENMVLDEKIKWAAQEIKYDPETRTIVATGQVEIRYDGNVLFADQVSYSQQTDQAVASGNIKFIDRNNDIIIAEKLVLSGTLREGVLEGVQIFFKEGERLAAERGKRTGGRWTTIYRVVYTPCEVCDEDGNDKAPLWKIKAKSVVHDQDKKTLTYDNAFLELLGVPVFYSPWLRHPDATVDKASGFLTPKLDSSSLLGLSIEIPFFWNIAPHKDLTLLPKFTTDEGVILGAEYRHRVHKGTFSFEGSITYPHRRDAMSNRLEGNEIRGHLFGVGRFTAGTDWTWGFDANLASDDTYLRRYDVSRANTLTNRLYIEKLSGRNNFSVTGYAFQGLREEDKGGETPIVLPLVEYNFVGRPGWLGGRFGADASMVMLTRTDGTDTFRLSTSGSWHLPYVSPFGEIYRLTLGFRGDLYRTFQIAPEPVEGVDEEETDHTDGRIVPYAMLEWRLPFLRRGKGNRQIVEPIVSIVTSPTGGNPDGIPNEDSLSFEFDSTNLFSLSRYSGRDRWEGGTRFNYAVKFSHYADSGAQASLIVGQSYRLQRDDTFTPASGLDDKLSDIVIGAQLNMPGLFDYSHRIRIDKDSLKLVRHEGLVVFGPKKYRFSVGYTDVRRAQYGSPLPDRQEIRTAADIELSRYWRVFADFSHDFEADGGPLTVGGGFTYEDECLKFQIRARRDFTSDRDVLPNTSIGFRLIFKVVGG